MCLLWQKLQPSWPRVTWQGTTHYMLHLVITGNNRDPGSDQSRSLSSPSLIPAVPSYHLHRSSLCCCQLVITSLGWSWPMLISFSMNSYKYNINTFVYMRNILFDMYLASVMRGWRVFYFWFAFCFHGVWLWQFMVILRWNISRN